MNERIISGFNVAIFVAVRVMVTILVCSGILKILIVANPIYQWAPVVGDGVSLFGLGLFLFLCLGSQ